MRTQRLSILAVCLAAAGCAHGKSAESSETTARAEAAENARATDHEAHQVAEAPQNGEQRPGTDEDRVAVPEARRRGEMASTGDTLPSPKQGNQGDKPARAEEFGTEADNTRVNERDRGSAALTPMDQSGAESDIDITQRIRKDVVADDSLSFSAKNIKIITRDGRVTLRGTVKSKQERDTIEQAARNAAGPGKVTNELEIAK